MTVLYNVYCDESCHLQNDHIKVMVLGAIWCPKEDLRSINQRIAEIKVKHKVKPGTEVKWIKVSPARLKLYLELVDYFFDNQDLHFRGILVPDKGLLDHELFGQTHDTWYYKMYFGMLKTIFDPTGRYRIYLDEKDTIGAKKVRHLHEVLCNSRYDFNRKIIERVQTVRSHELQILQICDIIIGAIGYANRRLSTSQAKLKIVDRIRERSGYTLNRTTLLKENKINLLVWEPKELAPCD